MLIVLTSLVFAQADLTVQEPGSWVTLETGLEFAVFDLPASSFGDSRVRVLRVHPDHFTVALRAGVAGDGAPKTASEWAESQQFVAAFNPSMFRPDGTSTALMRDKSRSVRTDVTADRDMLVFDPSDGSSPAFAIADNACDNFDTVLGQYSGAIQSIRMFSCDGRNVWSQQPKMWSHAVVAVDGSGRLLLLHARSPYSTHDFVDLVINLPIDVQRMQYAEGGPEASLAVRTPAGSGTWFGSYETSFYESDSNEREWPLPNILGIVRRVP